VAAARELFEAKGYAATTMAAVADTAGVPVAEVEAAFGNKVTLLQAALDAAAAGDSHPSADRPWAHAAGATSDPMELLSRQAVNVRARLERIAPLAAVLHAAASTDPDLVELAARFDDQRAVQARIVITELANRGALRPELDVAEATDVLWLLQDPSTYLRLVVARGWSPAMYQTWLAETAIRLLVSVRRTRPA